MSKTVSQKVKKIYDYYGDNGVFSANVETFLSCFNIFNFDGNTFMYRLKSPTPTKYIKGSDGLFSAILHDPMEILNVDDTLISITHIIDIDDGYPEIEKTITYDEFLDKSDRSNDCVVLAEI